MKNIVFAIVFLSPPIIKKIILRWLCGAEFGRGSGIGWFSSVMGEEIRLGEFSIIKPFTLIHCDGIVKLGDYSEVSSFNLIYGCASFKVGNKCYLGPQSLINVSEDVIIGNGVGIGARTMIYTHGSFLPYTEGYWVKFGRVIIGDRVWLAAGVFIHPGVEIGENVFVNSRSVISRSIPAGMIVEGFPAKEIGKIEKFRRQVNPGKRDTLIKNILKHFIEFIKGTRKDIIIKHIDDDLFIFKRFNRWYAIGLINHQGIIPAHMSHAEYRKIALVNHPEAPIFSSDSKFLKFDFTSMKASFSEDKVFQDLYMFFKQYYGLIFRYDFNS